MEAIKNSREMFSRVNEFLDIVLEERGNRIVIFVDELDRCKPSYAVRLLERIKHYFSKETITFVFSINAMELQHTIKQYYGANFDASRYLDRFFDLRVSLPPANMQKYFSLISADSQNHTYDIVARDVAKKYRFELRELAKYFRLVKIASSKAIRKKTAETFVHPEGKGKWFALMTLVPLMIGLQLYDLNLYDSFVCGENYEPLLDLLLGEEYTDWLCRVLLTPNETIKDTGIQNETVVDLRDKIVAFYDAIFNTTYDNYSNCRKRIGGLTIVEETQSFVKGVVSLLSDCADYAE